MTKASGAGKQGRGCLNSREGSESGGRAGKNQEKKKTKRTKRMKRTRMKRRKRRKRGRGGLVNIHVMSWGSPGRLAKAKRLQLANASFREKKNAPTVRLSCLNENEERKGYPSKTL